MSVPASKLLCTAALAACALVAGCGTVDGFSRRVADAVTPYKVEVVQGNFVSREQVELLKPGMTRQQVREVLGSPLITDLFHADRWDYVFTLKRQGVEPQRRHLAVFFKGDVLDRFEGDAMPSESEFVAAIGGKHKPGKVPVLQASEEQLQRAAKPAPAAPGEAAPAPPAPPAATTYPPLEPPAR